MNKNSTILGIDISKDSFDVYGEDVGHKSFKNTQEGFRSFRKVLDSDSWVVMEATGSYHQRLAMFLHQKGIALCVVNPLVIKRFIQMKLNRVKTDKSDARMICQYGQHEPLKLWKPDPEYMQECKQLQSVIAVYTKQQTALKNKLHSLTSSGRSTGCMVRSIKRQLKALKREITTLDNRMDALIKEHERDVYTRIQSIPGLGKKTAMLLIVATNGFRDFESSKQIASYLGLAPHERSSGSSVRGSARIGKNGHPAVRNHLFLCSFTA